MGQYVEFFNKIVASEGDNQFIVALIKTTQQYLLEKYFQDSPTAIVTADDPFFDTLNSLVKYLLEKCEVSSVEELERNILLLDLEKKIGTILPFFKSFSDLPGDTLFPQEYAEVFEEAKKIEEKQRLQYILSLRYSDIEGAEPILNEIVVHILELEKILNRHLCRADEESKVKSKVSYWIGVLADKSSRLFLETGSLLELRASVEAVFDNQLITAFNQQGCALAKFKKRFLFQIEFLETQHFFEEFYQQPNYVEKYDYVSKFFKRLEKQNEKMEHYKVVLGGLIQQIIEREYKTMLEGFNQTDPLKYKNVLVWMQKSYHLAGLDDRRLVIKLITLEQQKAFQPSRTYKPLKRAYQKQQRENRVSYSSPVLRNRQFLSVPGMETSPPPKSRKMPTEELKGLSIALDIPQPLAAKK